MTTREIKFRGKRLDNNEWIYGDLLHPHMQTDAEWMIYPRTDLLNGGRPVKSETIGQYTGMTDKNGTPIYEGDIVMKRTYHGKKPMKVTFSFGVFHCGFGGGSSTATHPYTLDDNQIEVIGNIYNNPELLKQAR